MKKRRQQRDHTPRAHVASLPRPTDRQRIAWLLDFLRQDLAVTRPGALFDLRNDAIRYLQHADDGLVDARTKEWRAVLGPLSWMAQEEEPHAAAFARERLTDIQARLWEGTSALSQGRYWQPFSREQPVPGWTLRPTEDGAVVRIFDGDVTNVIIASAVDLLMRWWTQLRRCKHCQGLFLPRHGRQWYHDAQCSWKARYARFKPKRDYVKEEQRRAARELARKRKRRT